MRRWTGQLAVALAACLLLPGCIVSWDPNGPPCHCLDLPEPKVRAQFHGYEAKAVPSTLEVAKGQVVEWKDKDGWLGHRRVTFVGHTGGHWKGIEEDRNLTWELHHGRYRARPLVEGTFAYTACEGCELATLVVLPAGVSPRNPPAIHATVTKHSPIQKDALQGVAFHPDGFAFSAVLTVGSSAPLPIAVENGTWNVPREAILLGDGTYPYRIEAVDERGLASHVSGTVTLPNRSPVVVIEAPMDFTEVRQPFLVRGQAHDLEGDEFTLAWFPGWDSTQPWRVVEVVDGRWEFTVPEGTFVPGHAQLTLPATDDRNASGLRFLVVEVL